MSVALKPTAGNLLLAVGYAALGWLGLSLCLPGTNAAPLWPAAGLALACTWRWGPRLAPGVALGSFATNLLGFGLPWWAALLTALGAGTSAALGGWALRHHRVARDPSRLADILLLILVMAASALLAALVGSTALALTLGTWAGWITVAWTWWSGDLVGMLVLTPLATQLPMRIAGGSAIERTAVGILALAAPLAVFALPGSGPITFLALPPLLWAALRCGPPGAAAALALLAGTVWAMTAAGLGPLAAATESVLRGALLQSYLATAALMALLLATVSRSRELAIAERVAGEERYRLVAENARDLICLHELDGRLRWVSPSAHSILGHAPEELVGRDPLDLIHPEDAARVRATLLADAPDTTVQYRCRTAAAGWVWLEAMHQPVRDRSGAVVAVQSVARDVTRRRADEELLEQARRAAALAERMAAIGTLAGGVAHEFNNLNSVILGNVELTLRRTEIPPDARRRLELVREAVERERGIVDALLAFSSAERGPGQISEIGAMVGTTIALARRTLRQRQVILHVDLPKQPLYARIAGGALGQVLLNLMLNACDAIDRRHDPQIWIQLSQAGGRARLAVRDNGIGIRPEDLTRIFLPFFSTKGEHADVGLGQPWLKGTGLGLSVCQTLVDQLGGTIEVASAPDAGATFTVTVPLVDAPAPAHDSGPRPVSCARVLVVDDEPEIRRLLAEHLAAAGHVAVEAEDGQHALERLALDNVDLVLLNWNMPGIDGQAFLEHLDLHPERRWPPVVVVSGWMGGDSGIDRWQHEIAGQLRKPFSLEQVRDTVHSALHGARPERITGSSDDSALLPGP